MIERKRFIVNNDGKVLDTVTGENFDTVEEVVDVLNYYEDNCLRYQKTITELKKGTYKETLPITQRK